MPTTLPVADPLEKTDSETDQEFEPRWHVILFDDDEHTYQYVIGMMMNLFAMTLQEGYDIAYEVDNLGQACVMTTSRSEAEEAQKKIISYGPDHLMPNSKGSMGCIIERAD